jgi:hypothetical protein
LRSKTGLSGQLPIPGHGYLWHFCPPKAVSGGTRGYMIKCCVAAGSDAGYDAARSFKFDLETGLWTYASDNNINFDGQYLNPYTDGGGAWDPVSNRFYTPQKGAYTDQLRYLEKTAAGWTWGKTSCPGMRNVALATVFVEGRDLVIAYTDGTWQKVNLEATAAGASYFTMVNSGLVPGIYQRWHKYPVDGCWYALRGKADRGAITSWPGSGSPPTTLAADQFLLKIDPVTWTVSKAPIAGGIVALWENYYSAAPPHGNAFIYVPQLQCFAWFPRPDGPVQLIKPPAGGTSGGDTQPPTVPANLRVTSTTPSSVAWAWDASTDNGGGTVAGYRVTLFNASDVAIGSAVEVGNVLAYTASGLTAGTTYKLAVSAYDNAAPPNASAWTAAVAGTTSGTAPDTQPPSTPTALRVAAVTETSVAWSWNASTDAGGGVVAGYRVTLYDKNGLALGTTDVGNVLAYTAAGLRANTSYSLRVSAYDNAAPANTSPPTAPVAGTTLKKAPPGKGGQ